jgi:hypothetical protein
MPSSTSNFKAETISSKTSVMISEKKESIPYRDIPEKPWFGIFIIAMCLMVVMIIRWEMLARDMEHTAGTYQTGFDHMWAVERRKLDKVHDIKVVIVGSSRILWGIDMAIMAEHIGSKPLQLALPGTGPALFVEDIVNNTDFNGLLLVGVAPFLFNRMDEGFFGKGALNAYHKQSPANYSGAVLHNFISDYFAFLDEAFGLTQLLNHYQTLPYRVGSKKLKNDGWKLGNVYQDRLTEMWAPVEQAGGFDNVQVTNFWSGGLARTPPTPEEMAKMVTTSSDFYGPLLAKLRARGGDMVFLRLPSSGDYLKFDLKSDYYGRVWQPTIQALDIVGINAMEHEALSTGLDTPEWSHLTRASQDEFSHLITDHINRVYQAKNNKSIHQLLDTKPAD